MSLENPASLQNLGNMLETPLSFGDAVSGATLNTAPMERPEIGAEQLDGLEAAGPEQPAPDSGEVLDFEKAQSLGMSETEMGEYGIKAPEPEPLGEGDWEIATDTPPETISGPDTKAEMPDNISEPEMNILGENREKLPEEALDLDTGEVLPQSKPNFDVPETEQKTPEMAEAEPETPPAEQDVEATVEAGPTPIGEAGPEVETPEPLPDQAVPEETTAEKIAEDRRDLDAAYDQMGQRDEPVAPKAERVEEPVEEPVAEQDQDIKSKSEIDSVETPDNSLEQPATTTSEQAPVEPEKTFVAKGLKKVGDMEKESSGFLGKTAGRVMEVVPDVVGYGLRKAGLETAGEVVSHVGESVGGAVENTIGNSGRRVGSAVEAVGTTFDNVSEPIRGTADLAKDVFTGQYKPDKLQTWRGRIASPFKWLGRVVGGAGPVAELAADPNLSKAFPEGVAAPFATSKASELLEDMGGVISGEKGPLDVAKDIVVAPYEAANMATGGGVGYAVDKIQTSRLMAQREATDPAFHSAREAIRKYEKSNPGVRFDEESASRVYDQYREAVDPYKSPNITPEVRANNRTYYEKFSKPYESVDGIASQQERQWDGYEGRVKKLKDAGVLEGK